VFQDPSVFMQQLLTQQHPATLGPYKHETDCMFPYSISCPTFEVLGAVIIAWSSLSQGGQRRRKNSEFSRAI